MTQYEISEIVDVEASVIINLSFGKIGLQKKGDMRKVETDADKSRCGMVKKLYDCEEIAAIANHDYNTTKYIKARISLEGFIAEGFYILAASFVDEVETFLQTRKQERAELVEKFCAVYEGERERARVLLASQFQDKDYPIDPRPKFKMSWRWLSFGVPQSAPPEAVETFRADMRAAMESVTLELRQQFAQLVGHLTEKLQPGPDGKKKIFRDTTLENLTEFLALVDRRNITKDSDLALMTKKAREMLDGITPDQLRDDKKIRDQVSGNMQQLENVLTELVTTKSARKFRFDE